MYTKYIHTTDIVQNLYTLCIQKVYNLHFNFGKGYDLFKAMHARPRCNLINPHLLIIHFPSSVAHCHFQKKQSLHIVLLIRAKVR